MKRFCLEILPVLFVVAFVVSMFFGSLMLSPALSLLVGIMTLLLVGTSFELIELIAGKY